MPARELAERRKECAPLRQESVVGGQRLDDHRGNARAFAREELGHRRLVIERQHARAGGESLRHACGGGPAEGGEPGARRHEQVVGVTVVAAGELDDELTPGEGARHADGTHDRLGAGGDEPHLFGRGVSRHDTLGELDLRRARRAVGHPARERRGDRRDDRRVRVTGDERPPRADQVEVSAAVGIEHLRARPARDEERRASHGSKSAHWGAHATWDDAAGTLVELGRARPERFAFDRGRLWAHGSSVSAAFMTWRRGACTPSKNAATASPPACTAAARRPASGR